MKQFQASLVLISKAQLKLHTPDSLENGKSEHPWMGTLPRNKLGGVSVVCKSLESFFKSYINKWTWKMMQKSSVEPYSLSGHMALSSHAPSWPDKRKHKDTHHFKMYLSTHVSSYSGISLPTHAWTKRLVRRQVMYFSKSKYEFRTRK